MPDLICPECGEEVWDGPSGSKLAKCWNSEGHASGGTLAFDTMEEDDDTCEPLPPAAVLNLVGDMMRPPGMRQVGGQWFYSSAWL